MNNKNTVLPDQYSIIIKNKKIEEKIKMINEIHEATVMVPKNRLPLSVFKSYFAPHFFNKVDADKKDPNIIKNWISIAGAATAGVDVFDDVTREVVFTTPGMLDTTIINPIVEDALPFENIMNMFVLRSDRLASDGARYLREKTESKLEQTMGDVDPIIEESTKVWVSIYNYCYSGSNSNNKPSSGKLTNLSKNDDDLEHEF